MEYVVTEYGFTDSAALTYITELVDRLGETVFQNVKELLLPKGGDDDRSD